uniref:Uncharacterized protein n=1 Tax=Anguilla anguilla TaxID=7936 RepID=A0A0E9SZH5_ANGAN
MHLSFRNKKHFTFLSQRAVMKAPRAKSTG